MSTVRRCGYFFRAEGHLQLRKGHLQPCRDGQDGGGGGWGAAAGGRNKKRKHLLSLVLPLR